MASLLSYALTTVEDVKESLGIPSSDTSKDNLIKRKINQATRLIENYCGRHFKLTTYTNELYNATGIDQIILRNRPIVGDVSLGVRDTSLNDDDFENVESTLLFADNDSGVLDLNFRATGHWGRYRVTYSAGYAEDPSGTWPDGLPEDLREAAAALAGYYASNADGSSIGVAEKQEGQRRIRYSNNNVASSAGGGGLSFDSIIRQLGIDETLNSYSNNPLMTDR